MKTNCDVIKDLMPLYVDDVCTMESKKLVEEHIMECVNCNNDLIQMNGEIPHIPNQLNESFANEINPLKKIKKRNNRKLILVTTSVIITALLFCIVFAVFIKKGADSNFIEVKVDYKDVNVNNIIEEVKKTLERKWEISKDILIVDMSLLINPDGQLMNLNLDRMKLYDPIDNSYYDINILSDINAETTIQVFKNNNTINIDQKIKKTLEWAIEIFKTIDITSLPAKNYDFWTIRLPYTDDKDFDQYLYLEKGEFREDRKSSLAGTEKSYDLIFLGYVRETDGWSSSGDDTIPIIVKP